MHTIFITNIPIIREPHRYLENMHILLIDIYFLYEEGRKRVHAKAQSAAAQWVIVGGWWPVLAIGHH